MDDAPEVADAALPCPLCGYDLRATPAGRCPECGHWFEPNELRRRLAERARIGWFVESARPRWWSGWATSARALVPWRFWRDVTPELPMRPWRRAAFVVAGVGVCLLILFPIINAPGVWRIVWWFWQTPLAYQPAELLTESAVTLLSINGWHGWTGIWLGWQWRAAAVAVTLPLLTFAASAVFWQTRRRAGVRLGHLWRVAAYGTDSRLAVIPAAALALVVPDGTDFFYWYWGKIAFVIPIEWHSMAFAAVLWLLATSRVVAAYVLYLRLPRPVLTALLAQAVVAIALCVVMLLAAH